MSVTLDTFHSRIGPCVPLEQSPVGDTSRHASTALLSSALDFGENASAGRRVAVGLSSKQRATWVLREEGAKEQGMVSEVTGYMCVCVCVCVCI